MLKSRITFLQGFFSIRDYRMICGCIMSITTLELIVPILCTWLIDRAIPDNDYLMATLCALGLLISVCVEYLLRRKKQVIAGKALVDYQLCTRQKMVDNYASRSYADASRIRFAHISSILVQDVDMLCALVYEKIPNAVSSALFCVVALVVLFWTNFWMTTIVGGVIGAFLILVINLKKTLANNMSKTAESRVQLNLKVQELLHMGPVIRLNSLAKQCIRQLMESEKNYLVRFLKSNIVVPSIQSSIEIATMITYLGLFVSYSFNGLTAGTIFLFCSYLAQIWKNFSNMMDLFNHITTAEVYANRIKEVCNSEKNYQGLGTKTVSSIETIRFCDVCFAYDGRYPVLQNINFSVTEPGMYYLVGPSGAGKTTIFNLLLGLYSSQGGEILINGIRHNEIDICSLHQNIGFVQQEKYFFNKSILENIALDRKLSKTELLAQIEELSIGEYFFDKPRGLDTQVTDFGANLSVGEKAMISLLRACCMRPSVLLVDEITINVEEKCKKDIERLMRTFSENCMVIQISHDSTVLGRVESNRIIKL